MDWADEFLKKSCNKSLSKTEVLHSLFHMIEINEKTLEHIQSINTDFGPELAELKENEVNDLNFHLKYYRGLVNFISGYPENRIIEKS